MLLIAAVIFAALTGMIVWKRPTMLVSGFFMECALLCLLMGIICLLPRTDAWFEMVRLFLIFYYICIILIGTELLLNGIDLLRRERLCLAHLLPLIFSVCCFAVGIFGLWDMQNVMSGSEFSVRLRTVGFNLINYIPLAFGVIFNYMWIYRYLVKQKKANTIIVLGCSIRKNGDVTPLLKGRLDKALEEYRKGGENATFLVSGGQGKNEVISEAEAMKRYLMSQGIPEDKILLEDQSTTTGENLRFSAKIMKEQGMGNRCLVATSSYHVLRAVTLAKQARLDAYGVGGKTAAYYYPAAFFREYIALIFRHKYVVAIYVIVAVAMAFL